MNIEHIDLNLLVYLDVLLRERNVTRAAGHLGISQPAMSNGLRRLRETFNDPILVRTTEGMLPTDRALAMQPMLRQALATIEHGVLAANEFEPASSDRVFRIMTSDYGEATLLPKVLERVMEEAPNVVLDILTPSDLSYSDVEQGQVDLVINRFDSMPQSFHQVTLWRDTFSCMLSPDHPIADKFNLQNYLASHHVWVNKTGMGSGVGLTPQDTKRLGWVDGALSKAGKQRHITVFTRHYQSACLLAQQKDLIVTIPSKIASMYVDPSKMVVVDPPFEIPEFDFKMAWSPLLQHNRAHRWLRRLIAETAQGPEHAW